MKLETSRFGMLEVDEAQVVRFAAGLPGFPDCVRFVVLEHDRDTPLKWLQSVDRGEVAFLVVEPEQVLAEYQVEVPEDALAVLGFEETPDAKQIGVFLILSVEEDSLSANLRAPVVVNMDKRHAVQLILEDTDAPVRQQIAPG